MTQGQNMSCLTRAMPRNCCVALAALSFMTVGTLAVHATPTDAHAPLSFDGGVLARQAEVGGRAQRLAQEAAAAYVRKDYEKAIRLYSEVIQLVPRDARLFYNRGNSYYKLGDLDRALADFSEAVVLVPDFVLALMNRANIYSKQSRFEDAIADYNKAIGSNPGDFLIFYNRAVANQRLGRLSEAVVDLNQAIRLKPDDAQSYVLRGEVLQKQGDLASAQADLERANELKRSAAQVTMPLGRAESPAQMAMEPILKGQISLLKSACWDNGENEAGLRTLAVQSNWKPVGEGELRRRSDNATIMIGGWTFAGTLGDAAVIQSRGALEPSVHVCSFTTRLTAPATERAVKLVFENAFKASTGETVEQPMESKFRYWLPHRPGCDARVSLIFLRSANTFTVRMLHGRTRGQSLVEQFIE